MVHGATCPRVASQRQAFTCSPLSGQVGQPAFARPRHGLFHGRDDAATWSIQRTRRADETTWCCSWPGGRGEGEARGRSGSGEAAGRREREEAARSALPRFDRSIIALQRPRPAGPLGATVAGGAFPRCNRARRGGGAGFPSDVMRHARRTGASSTTFRRLDTNEHRLCLTDIKTHAHRHGGRTPRVLPWARGPGRQYCTNVTWSLQLGSLLRCPGLLATVFSSCVAQIFLLHMHAVLPSVRRRHCHRELCCVTAHGC